MKSDPFFSYGDYGTQCLSNLAPVQWEHIVFCMDRYIQSQTKILIDTNAGQREWQELSDIQGTLKDILYFILPDNKYEVKSVKDT